MSGRFGEGDKLQNGGADALVCPVTLGSWYVKGNNGKKNEMQENEQTKMLSNTFSLSLHLQFMLVLVTPVMNSPEAIIQGLPNCIPS